MKKQTIILIIAVAVAVGVVVFIKKRKATNDSSAQGVALSKSERIKQIQSEIEAIKKEVTQAGQTNEIELLNLLTEKETELQQLTT